jgi:hypothetical protein
MGQMRRRMRGRLLILGVVAGCAAVASSAPARAQTALSAQALQGAWKLVSLTYDGQPQKASGYLVFQGEYYTFVTSRERPRLPAGVGDKTPAQLEPEEVHAYVEAFRNMTAAAGPFSIRGDEILHVMEVVRTPNLAGQTEERHSRLENNRLVQDFMGGGRRQVYTWERVSAASR